MAHIFVCRHGQDLDNVEGILNGHRDRPLSELGRSQAAQVADTIKSQGTVFDAIYASPLLRAHQTATTIGAAVGVAVQVMPDLIERDFGVLTGRPYEDIPKYAGEKVLQTDKVLYFLEVEGGESFEELYARAQRVLQEVDAKHEGHNVLLVCHGDIGKMILAARRGITWREGLLEPYFANTEVRQI